MDFRKIPLSCLRDTPDPRDFRKFSAAPPIPLPETFDIPAQPPIKDQGQTNSCVAQAITWAWQQTLNSRGMLEYDSTLSAKFLWFWARWQTGDHGRDVGCQIRDGMKALKEHGAAPIEEWPESSEYNVPPSGEAEVWGSALALPSYERLQTIQEIKHVLAIEQQAVVIGLPIYEAFYGHQMQTNGIVPARSQLGNLVGWHAMAGCGFTRERCIFANSWGDRYAAHGFVYIPWEYFDYEKNGDTPGFDCWTFGVDSIPDVPPPQLNL